MTSTTINANALFQENQNLVYHVFNILRDAVPAPYYEDMTQEGFIALWKAANLYDPNNETNAKFGTYSFKLVYRAMIDYAKSLSRHSSRLSYYLDEPITNGDGSNDISKGDLLEDVTVNENSIIDTILVENMKANIELLPPNEQEVILLFLKNLNQNEIAQRVGVTQKTISKRYNSALRILKALMDRET